MTVDAAVVRALAIGSQSSAADRTIDITTRGDALGRELRRDDRRSYEHVSERGGDAIGPR